MAALGLASTLQQVDLEPEPLARAILAALDQPRPEHTFNLNGAQETRRILESL